MYTYIIQYTIIEYLIQPAILPHPSLPKSSQGLGVPPPILPIVVRIDIGNMVHAIKVGQ